ncbi:hypothetical protein BST10_05075 [Mycolicibacter algericus DSM 45454]|uniref:Histone-like protein Hns n=2 Tax=Mycolicibacter algericus TaxID=1288388 RepID=A0A7I9YER8_MYCAL|nr:hypothetical protein [Mycolicibacter algericus]OQZ98202.1 hypothetical protein BST10_05075 [Mycolicibacter algericus DSM 45454]GFG87168.1 hypothetical protein MALGJ_38440 [Mycolicibacter algericus]
MTDPQGQPDHESAAAPEPAAPTEPARPAEPVEPPAAEPAAPATPPEPAQPAGADRPAEPPAKKAPAKAAKKTPGKAAKKAPAKAAKKAPAKKAPAKKAPGAVPAPAARPADTNGSGRLADGAKETAAQAKSTVDAARNPLTPSVPSPSRSPGAVLAAGVLGLLGLLLIRRLLHARRG